MATIENLFDLLADFTGLHPDTVRRHAGKLREAELLPVEDAQLEALHAVRLLVAVMAAPSPLQAVSIVRAYEALPAIVADFRSNGSGEAKSTKVRIEDVPLLPGVGPAFTRLTRAFIPALAAIIECWLSDRRCQVTVLGISRVPWRTMAYFEINAGRPPAMRFEYGQVEPESDDAASHRLHVTGFARGHILGSLAQLLRPGSGEPTKHRADEPVADATASQAGAQA